MTPEGDKDSSTNDHDERLRRVMAWTAVVLIAFFTVAVFSLLLWRGLQERAWLSIAQKQFAAVIGLPMSAIASLFVVLVLRIAAGPIEVEVGSFKFKGAAAPIVFWLLCFLSIATAIKLLWLPA
jgi:hypothetical protein